MKAILKVDENGNEYIKCENKQHICSPLNYDPQRYIELKIVKKPSYEIMENCSSKSKQMLIIFDSNDRNYCYEYYWCSNDKKFKCCACALKKKKITAVIVHENTEFEYIQLLNDGHVCEKRKYNPEKFNQIKKFVLLPNFEIQTRIKGGEERKSLIIFEGNNRKLCYTYYFQHSADRYYCNGCIRKRTVSAKIYQNDDGEEYVILSNVKHVCLPKKYIPQKNEITLRPPQIRFMKSNEKYRSKLFIFEPNNLNLCYIFSKNSEGISRQYYCLGCRKSTQNSEFKKTVVVYLYEDDNDSQNTDGYYIRMMDGQTHICKPQKYEPEKFEAKILKPKDDYILFQTKEKKKESLCLAVYHPENKNLCYYYYYNNGNKIFRCKECEKKKIYVNAKIQQDSDGNEYIISNQKKHVCNPIKVSSIIKADTIILEKSGLTFEEPKKKEFDESQIIRLPNFELQRNIKGVPDRKLIVFKSDDRKLCYEYGYDHGQFKCKKCQIIAKLNSENGKKCIILSENEHKCEPVKYIGEKKIVGSSDFMIFYQNDKNKPTKLIIFTSSEKTDCYEYTFRKRDKTFQCVGCTAMKKIISAKLLVKENKEEYIQLLKNDHICSPKKFILEEFQPKTVPESEFQLFSNKNGKPNSKLIIFDPEKDGFCYEYYLDTILFKCNKCNNKNKHVTAKLCKKENGEKYLELSKEKHICKSTKYESEKFNKKIILDDFVVQHNAAGDPNSRLTIFDKNDKNLGYQYSFRKSNNAFYCCECSKRSKRTSAKLLIDGNGKQTVEFGKNEHVCEIQNFKEKNIIFNDFTFEENGNALITNNSKMKCYKFKYDSNLDAFCCMKCKEKKKKIITATVCNGNDGKEFIFLNDIHCCTALSK